MKPEHLQLLQGREVKELEQALVRVREQVEAIKRTPEHRAVLLFYFSGHSDGVPASCRSSGQGCDATAPCCSGLTCTNGACVNPPTCRGTGLSCSSSSSCCPGLTCTGGACAVTTTCQSAGQNCGTSTTSCCSGLSCQGGSCTVVPVCRDEGQGCSATQSCCCGFACTQGVCRAPQACVQDNLLCNSSSACCSGTCAQPYDPGSNDSFCKPACLVDGDTGSPGFDCTEVGCCRSASHCVAPPQALYRCRSTCASQGEYASSQSDCCAGLTRQGSGLCF